MGLMPEVEASLYEDSPKEKRKAEQRENNEQLVEMLAQKFQTPPSISARILGYPP